MLFLKYGSLFVMIRSMQERDFSKEVGFFIRCSEVWKKLEVFIFWSHNEIFYWYYIFECVERYGKIFRLLFKNIDLFLSRLLYAPSINYFLKRKFIPRKRVSLLSLCEFRYFTETLPLTCMHKSCAKLLLSGLGILYSAKHKWLFWKELTILVSDAKNISNALWIKGFSNSNLFPR